MTEVAGAHRVIVRPTCVDVVCVLLLEARPALMVLGGVREPRPVVRHYRRHHPDSSA